MSNVIDYVKWRGDITFAESPLNEIDALIFAEISYVPFDDLVSGSFESKGVPLSALADKFFSLNYDRGKLGAILPTESIIALFKIASESRRFSNVCIKGFINEVDIKSEKQFCAMCFDIGKITTVIVYRGTDDTIIGWKEDLNMAFFTPIPAQKRGEEYLNRVILNGDKDHYYVCGHSKGANLAEYSALMGKKECRDKIERVYSFDGPGFKKAFIESVKDNDMIPKIKKICPEGAIIGVIFDAVGECKFVKSTAKGLYQHDAFTWNLIGREFEYVDKPLKFSVDFHNILEDLVKRMSDEEKSEFVDALYKFLSVNESTTLSDIAADKFKFLLGVLKADEKAKKTVFNLMNKLIKEKYFKKELPKSKDTKK